MSMIRGSDVTESIRAPCKVRFWAPSCIWRRSGSGPLESCSPHDAGVAGLYVTPPIRGLQGNVPQHVLGREREKSRVELKRSRCASDSAEKELRPYVDRPRMVTCAWISPQAKGCSSFANSVAKCRVGWFA
ncbi:hypothetical protein TNCV_836691 [Trichonephila clavipes]|nr:hypothetical protein TNCV_836691 [Trichonephila clavipes]